MVKAMRGVVGDVKTYLDYGYFGVLGADFDEEGHSVGTYTPKKSYWAFQALSYMFAEDFECCEIAVFRKQMESTRLFGMDCHDATITEQGFSKPDGSKAYVYWNATNIMTTDFESTITVDVANLGNDIKIVDLMDGSVYKIPDNMIDDLGYNVYRLKIFPLKITQLQLLSTALNIWNKFCFEIYE